MKKKRQGNSKRSNFSPLINTSHLPLLIIGILIILLSYLSLKVNVLSKQQENFTKIMLPTNSPIPSSTEIPIPTIIFKQPPVQNVYFSPTPNPTSTPTPTPSPTSNPNVGKEAALKLLDEKINKINQNIAFLQSQVDSLLKQEDQCSTVGSSLEDPYAQSIAQAQCSQSYFSAISQIQYKIDSLIRERRGHEAQKIQIMTQS